MFGMEGNIDRNSISGHTKEILPSHGHSSVSLVIDNDYLAQLHVENERIDVRFGQDKMRFNCVRIADCKVMRDYVRSLAVFAQTVIIEDSSFDCEEIYFNLKNELEVRSGKLVFYEMKVEAKWVNIESDTLIDGNQLSITTSHSTSLSGGLSLETQFICRSQHISIGEHSSIAANDLWLLPAKFLHVRGSLRSKRLFIGDFDQKRQKVVTGTANVVISGEVSGDRVSIVSSNGVVLSGCRVSVNEMDCSSGTEVKVEKGCHLKVKKKLQVHAQTTNIDAGSVLEGIDFSFLIEEKVVLANFSSFQFDGLLAIECRSFLCGDNDVPPIPISPPTFRCGDVYILAAGSIEVGGGLKCRKLMLKCQQRAADVIIRGNALFDLDSLLVLGNSSVLSVGDEAGEIVLDSGSAILCSMFVAIEANNKEVVLKGSLNRALCHSPNLSIKTSKSIMFGNCSVDVGDSQLLFGDELVLENRANVCVSGKLFLLNNLKESDAAGILRLAKDCVLVVRKDLVCQFGECFVEGTLASEEGSILLGHNHNQDSKKNGINVPEGKTGTKEVIKKIVEYLNPSSSKPLLSLFRKMFQEKRIEFSQGIHLKKGDQKSFVMEYIFISGKIRAKKTVMLVSRDISIQNGSSIKCTAEWDSTAILMYSNRSVFQCSSELDASTVLVVSPIVFQLLSLFKAHNVSISAAVVIRLGCLCNSTKTILKSPFTVSGLNVVAPNVHKTLRKMRSDLNENFVDVVMLIERLAEARMENRAFESFLVESMKLFKKHSNLALIHSLELLHVALQIVNLLVPKTALIITMNFMSFIRATMFLLFSVKSIQRSIKRYLTSERHNFILIEIVGEGMFSLYQVVGLVTSFASLYNQIKKIRSTDGMNSSTIDVPVPTLKDLPRTILNRTRDLVSSGPLLALSNVLGVFDTFVLNDYTKYAVGSFSYLPSSMNFSIFNLSGELQMGMYVVTNSSTCSLNGSVIVLSYNCSSTNISSFSPRCNVVICNGAIFETSTIGKVDRGVKISQRSLVLGGGRRVHDGGFHFGESVVLKTKYFEQQNNNSLIYNQIGGFSMKKWKLHKSVFHPVSSTIEERSSYLRPTTTSAHFDASFGNDVMIVERIDESVLRSGNVIEHISIGDGSVFFLKDVALKINTMSGAVAMVNNVIMKLSGQMKELLLLQIAGGSNSLVSDSEVDVDFSIQLEGGGQVSIVSPSTSINCIVNGEGHVAFHNAEIGENASVQHTGSTLLELKDRQRFSDAMTGSGEYSKIANDGQVNFQMNGEFEIFSGDEKLFLCETPIRRKQDVGIIAGSIYICREVEREKGIQLFSVEEDIVIRKGITSKDGSVVINAKHGNVVVEDSIERGIIVTKCCLKLLSSRTKSMSRLERNVSFPCSSIKLIALDEVDIVRNVDKVELRAKESVVITSNEGCIIMDPCVIQSDKSVVLEGKGGVSMRSICVTSIFRKNSRNPFYRKRKKVIKGVAETTCITSNGDISIIVAKGSIFSSGIEITSKGGLILQSGRDGVFNESAVTKTSINEKVHVLGGLSQEHRKEKHDVESPCVFESSKGIFMESERGSIVNVGMVAKGNGVCSFNAKNVMFERRILKHEVTVKKQGFDLSLSILGVDIFESSSSTFLDNLRMEFLENHLPPIGNSPIEVARSVREGNVPEMAANLVNALLIPGNLRFLFDVPAVKFGIKFNDYDLHHHKYDSLGEGMIEMDFLYINAGDTVKFSNAFGFNAGSVEIEAPKLIENGAFLNYELENFSSGLGFGFEPFGGDILQCVPSISADLVIAKESCSVAVCQIGNTAFMKVNVGDWDKNGSQTFAETVEGMVETVSFDSTSTVTEGKRHGISLGTKALGLSDGHSRSSLIFDQTGLHAVNVDDFHVKSVFLKSSRCPVRGTDETIGEESIEFEKVSGTSLGVDFSNFISLTAITIFGGCGGKHVSKFKGVGIEKKDYLAVVQNSFENVNESEFHYRSSHNNDAEREAMNNVKSAHQNYETLTRNDNKPCVNEDEGATNSINKKSAFLTPVKNVLKDRGFELKFHFDRNYDLLQDGIIQMHKEVVDEGLLPCLEGAAFEDVDPQLLFPVLDIFYDPSTSELDKYTQMLFFQDGEKSKLYCDLTESEKQEVFVFQSYLQDGGDFRDFISLCNFYEDKKQSLSDEYAKKSMKEYIRETYPELYLSTGLDYVQNVEEVRRVFMDVKFAYEPDDPMVRQLTFEMDSFYAEQIFEASWAELSSSQQKEIVKIREHALIYQQTDQEVDFAEYLNAKEAQFVDYFANHHQEPDTNVLTSFGVLPIELLKDPDPILSECLPYRPPLDSERKYPFPGSGLFFLLAPAEKGGWEGICEYSTTVKNCTRDYFSYILSGRPIIVDDYQPSQREVCTDKFLRSFFSGVLDLVPFINGAKWGYQGFFGHNPITKDLLDWKERIFDLTFSMFYFPPVANVIIGYGKGAVWEPLKGAWLAGKIIVKDRTLKGVFGTIRATASATIESIALPTQHLGMFLEMKMVWGVNSGTASLRSAGSWVSNQMNKWKAGFWSKWKWSRRHFDVMTTTIRFTSASNFAYATGASFPVVAKTGNSSSHYNHPFLEFAKEDTSGSFSKVGKKGADEVVVKGGSKRVKTKNDNVVANKKDKGGSSSKDFIDNLKPMKKYFKNYLTEIISNSVFKKVVKGLEKSKKTGMNKTKSSIVLDPSQIHMPRLYDGDYKAIMERFNKDPRVKENPHNVRTEQQVKYFRARNGEKILQMVRLRMAKLGLLKDVSSTGKRCLSNVHPMEKAAKSYLLELLTDALYNKLLMKQWGSKKPEARHMPRLSDAEYKVIMERFNTEPRVCENPHNIRNEFQIKKFRNVYTKEIMQTIQEKMSNNPWNTRLISQVQPSIAKMEHGEILIDLISKKIYEKIKKRVLVNSDPGPLKKGQRQVKEIRRPPPLCNKDYKAITEVYNAEKSALGGKQTQDDTLIKRVKNFRMANSKEILQRIREINAKQPSSKRLSCPVFMEELPIRDRVIKGEVGEILIELISEKYCEKTLLLLESGEEIHRLPYLRKSDYEKITKRFNSDPRVDERSKRSIAQVAVFREHHINGIHRKIKERMKKSGWKFSGRKAYSGSVKKTKKRREILIKLISDRLYNKVQALVESGKTEIIFPTLFETDYIVIAAKFNADPRVNKKLITAKQVKTFRRKPYHKRDIFHEVRGRVENRGWGGHVFLRYRSRMKKDRKRALIRIISEQLYKKVRKEFDRRKKQSRSVLKILRANGKSNREGLFNFPSLIEWDYIVIAKQYNAHPIVCKDGLKGKMSPQQIMDFRHYNFGEIYRSAGQLVRDRIPEANKIHRSIRCPLLGEKKQILTKLISEKICDSIVAGGKKIEQQLPTLSRGDFSAIAEKFNANARVKDTPEYFRTGAQVRTFRWHSRKAITEMVQEEMEKRGLKSLLF